MKTPKKVAKKCNIIRRHPPIIPTTYITLPPHRRRYRCHGEYWHGLDALKHQLIDTIQTSDDLLSPMTVLIVLNSFHIKPSLAQRITRISVADQPLTQQLSKHCHPAISRPIARIAPLHATACMMQWFVPGITSKGMFMPTSTINWSYRSHRCDQNSKLAKQLLTLLAKELPTFRSRIEHAVKANKRTWLCHSPTQWCWSARQTLANEAGAIERQLNNQSSTYTEKHLQPLLLCINTTLADIDRIATSKTHR